MANKYIPAVRTKTWFLLAVVAAAMLCLVGLWQLGRGNAGGWIIIFFTLLQLFVAWHFGYRVVQRGSNGGKTMKRRQEPDERTTQQILWIKVGVFVFSAVVFVAYGLYSILT